MKIIMVFLTGFFLLGGQVYAQKFIEIQSSDENATEQVDDVCRAKSIQHALENNFPLLEGEACPAGYERGRFRCFGSAVWCEPKGASIKAATIGWGIVATDVDSGLSAHIDESGQGLIAKDKSGKTVWSVDVVRACGVPSVGEPKVRQVSIRDGKVHAVFGKHSFATVDLRTGDIQCLGAD